MKKPVPRRGTKLTEQVARRRPPQPISISTTLKTKHDYPDNPDNLSRQVDDIMGALHDFGEVVQKNRARRVEEQYEEVAEAYRYSVMLRDSPRKWKRYVDDQRWVGVKGRPKADERADAVQSVFRLVWGVLQGDPDASSLRYRAVRKFWADGVAPSEISNKIVDGGGFRKLGEAKAAPQPAVFAASKQLAVSNKSLVSARLSGASNASTGRQTQAAKAPSQVTGSQAIVTLKGKFLGPWGHLRVLTTPVVLLVSAPGSEPIRFSLDAIKTEWLD